MDLGSMCGVAAEYAKNEEFAGAMRQAAAINSYDAAPAGPEPDRPALDSLLCGIGDVRRTDEGYDVDGGRFFVRMNGKAGYVDESGSRHVITMVLQESDAGVMPQPDGGLVRAGALTMSIASKVLFLVRPHLFDLHFMHQLPQHLREHLRERQCERYGRPAF